MEPFAIRGFNPCESLLRHTPEDGYYSHRMCHREFRCRNPELGRLSKLRLRYN